MKRIVADPYEQVDPYSFAEKRWVARFCRSLVTISSVGRWLKVPFRAALIVVLVRGGLKAVANTLNCCRTMFFFDALQTHKLR
jgi:hypothetical protein